MKNISRRWTLSGILLFLVYNIMKIDATKERSRHVFVGSSSKSTSPERKIEHKLTTRREPSPGLGHSQKHLKSASGQKRKLQERTVHSADVNINYKKQKHLEPFKRNPKIDSELENLQRERLIRLDKMYQRQFTEDMNQFRWPHGTVNRDQIIHLHDQSKEKEGTARRQALASKLLSKTNNVISDVLERQSAKSSQTAQELKSQYEHLEKTSNIDVYLIGKHREEEDARRRKVVTEHRNADKEVIDLFNRHGHYFKAKLDHENVKRKESHFRPF